jgi:hypothetical protein
MSTTYEHIGWYNPDSKRFCYDDEIAQKRPLGYAIPVYAGNWQGELDEWRKVFPGKTPAEAAEIVKEVIIRLENYQAQRPLTEEEKAWAEKAWQEYRASQPTSAEQQAKVDALGEKIWNHNFGPDANRRP